jgi:hypothetical protein
VALAGVLPATAVASSQISVKAPSTVSSGKRLMFSASSHYTAGPHEGLTLFVARHSACGRTSKIPRGADVIFRGTVDNYLSVSSFSDPLSIRSHWVLCAYLTAGGKVKAHASARFRVV